MDKHRFVFKLSLTYGGNLNYYKSFHLPISTLPVGTGSTLSIFKTNQSTLFLIEFPDKLSSFPSWRVKKGLFGRVQVKWGRIGRLSPRALGRYKRWKSLSFCEIWNTLPLLCFLLDSLTNKHCRTWSSMINLRIDPRTCQKLSKVKKNPAGSNAKV